MVQNYNNYKERGEKKTYLEAIAYRLKRPNLDDENGDENDF